MLLGRLASARTCGNLAGTIGAIEGLLRPLWPRVRGQAAAALGASLAQESDLDDIAVATMMRLFAALASERDLKVPFGVLVRKSVDFEVRDFRRARVDRAEHEQLREPAEMPEPPAAAAPVLVEQADALQAMLAPLSPRDRQLMIEREVLDLPVALVAERQRTVFVGSLRPAPLRPAADISPQRQAALEKLCISDQEIRGGGGGVACGEPAAIEREGAVLETAGMGMTEAETTSIAVLVPDGVSSITVTESNGSSHELEVSNNVAEIEDASATAVSYTMPNGSRHTQPISGSEAASGPGPEGDH